MKKLIQGITLLTTFAFTTPLYAICPQGNLKDCQAAVNTKFGECGKAARAEVDQNISHMRNPPSLAAKASMYAAAIGPCSAERRSGMDQCQASCPQ